MKIGEKISVLRRQKGWSQEELADRLGISRQSVSKWESGASVPDLDRILRLSDLFGVSTDALLKDGSEAFCAGIGGRENETEQELQTEKYRAERGRRVSMAEAAAFLDENRIRTGRIAVGVAACIISPACIILLRACAAGKDTAACGPG